LPPLGSNADYAANAIAKNASLPAYYCNELATAADANFLSDLGFLVFCYRNILTRDTDPEGDKSHAPYLAPADRHGVGRRLALFQVLNSLACSEEALICMKCVRQSTPFGEALGGP
jgi:hypothetical protein